ncbi:MAG TPA: hypothetical protein VGO48_02305 [Conexibacter sp.]|jgi:hypothetical protein|nr:hypothetical protein [Conexibacter sp.]
MTVRLLLITGAGASHRLSLIEDEPLPLMHDWALRLRAKIGPGFSSMTGLSGATDGVEFEETLGALFRWSDSLVDIERFRLMCKEKPDQNNHYPDIFSQAVGNARHNMGSFQGRLHESLFDEFGPERVDADKAVSAYRTLFEALGLSGEVLPDQLVCATTNYDRSLEMALAELTGSVRTGFVMQAFRSSVLEPLGLGAFQTNEPALLYLHGAVGWYRQQGSIISMPADQGFNPTLGTPAVLYPSPEKDIQRSETVQLWDEFRKAVSEATHILVLGHALNDAHLVRELRTAPGQLAVTFYAPGPIASGEALDRSDQDAKRIKKLLPTAVPIGVSFAADCRIHSDPVARWRAAAAA